MFEETGDEERSQGWTPFVLDTNGNGKRDDYVEPDQPLDPTKDKRLATNLYAVAVSPVDGSVWGTSLASAARLSGTGRSGIEPTRTALTEVYEPPFPATARAAATSIATACTGPRCRAGISRASTAASARGRSTDRRRRASIAPKAGRSIRFPDRSSGT
jgi:hypothetical protein